MLNSAYVGQQTSKTKLEVQLEQSTDSLNIKTVIGGSPAILQAVVCLKEA